MSRGGRGFSPRGGSSYRGRGSDSWNNGGSRGRSSFSGASRGRFNWFKENSSGFESRKYSGSSSGERFSSRGRGEDSSYRRYSRPEPSYSSRDHSHHRSRSPDSSRKRLRTESYGSQASSTRRSHEGSYSGGGDYNNRYSYSDDKSGGYGEERGGRFREDRRTTSFRDRSRDDYSHRKSESMMPPPTTSRHMSSSRPRGSYRGRISIRGSRGMSRILQARRNDSLIARKKFSESYAIRKQLLTAKVQSDAWRKLKIQKLRSRLALSKKAEKPDKANDEASEEEPEEDVENPDEELEEGETVEKKEKPVKKKVVKEEVADEEREEGEEVDDDDEEADEEGTVVGDIKKEGGVQITIKQDSDTRDVSEDSHSRNVTPNYRRHFIRLSCPHCHYRCVTFKEYSMHMYSSKHVSVMRKLSLVHKQKLVSMRISQRKEQRLLEESEELEGVLAPHTNFCHICKLNYRQLKTQHMVSDSHQAMRTFLLPYCRVCRVSFKSPMVYENHLCSLEHIKRKSRLEERMLQLKGEDNGSGSEADSDDKDLDKYMTLDSVGTVDAVDDVIDEDGEPVKDDGTGLPDLAKPEVNLGSEYLRKVEVYYCDLCKLYLPRSDQQDRAVALHCTSRNHLQRYIRCRNDRALRKKAENIHQKEKAEANKINTETKNKEDKTSNGTDDTAATVHTTVEKAEDVNDSPVAVNASLTSESQSVDEKLWADVDKDLGDLIDQVDTKRGSSDDEEEADGGRYDRFRYSSKQGSAEAISEADSVGIKVESEEKQPNDTQPGDIPKSCLATVATQEVTTATAEVVVVDETTVE